MTFGMAPWHLVDERERHKEALVSQSPITAFKSCNMLQALGIVYSKIVLPSSDSKGESGGKTYCPTTWNKSYQRQYAAEYADQLRQVGASALLCQECTLSVIIQLSKKSTSHPNCAFADSASTVMSGVMISLTPRIKPEVDCQVAFDEYAEFQDADDMIQQLNLILSKPHSFPPIPAPRKDCHTLTFVAKTRHHQYVMCPEQDCENLVYFSDQNRSMSETLDLHEHPFWEDRVKAFYKWFNKSASKTSKDAWTWEEGKDSSKWSTTRGTSKRSQSVPANPADRPNPEAPAVQWRDIGDLDTSLSYLYPECQADQECPVPRNDYLEKEHQQAYMQWIVKTLDLDRRTSKDPRLYCAYCHMNNHPRFSCKHAFKHQKPSERHRCTLCTGHHPPFLYSRAQINGGEGKPNWHKIECKRAKQESKEPDFRWGEAAAQVQPDFPTLGSQGPSEAPQPQCAAAAMMNGLARGASSSWQGGCPSIAEHQEWYPPVPQQHVIVPNPGYKIEANMWHLDVKDTARRPGPIASFLVIVTPWTVHLFQAISTVVDSQQTLISAAMLLWRLFESFRGIAKKKTSI